MEFADVQRCSFRAGSIASSPNRRDEMTENELRYRRYRMGDDAAISYDGADYYVCKNWGGAPFEHMLLELRRWFPRISIRKKIG
jgi:hypothetical protein